MTALIRKTTTVKGLRNSLLTATDKDWSLLAGFRLYVDDLNIDNFFNNERKMNVLLWRIAAVHCHYFDETLIRQGRMRQCGVEPRGKFFA